MCALNLKGKVCQGDGTVCDIMFQKPKAHELTRAERCLTRYFFFAVRVRTYTQTHTQTAIHIWSTLIAFSIQFNLDVFSNIDTLWSFSIHRPVYPILPLLLYSNAPNIPQTANIIYIWFEQNDEGNSEEVGKKAFNLTAQMRTHATHKPKYIFIFLHVKINYYNTLPSSRTILHVRTTYICIFIFI